MITFFRFKRVRKYESAILYIVLCNTTKMSWLGLYLLSSALTKSGRRHDTRMYELESYWIRTRLNVQLFFTPRALGLRS